MKRSILILAFALIAFGVAFADVGVKKRRPLPYEYGRIVIDNYSAANYLPPVVFDHWIHRAIYTCRVCHVDVGFAMRAGATDIKAADNMSGYYCGACHNGKLKYNGKPIFEACAKNDPNATPQKCDKCHFFGKTVKLDYDFGAFTAKFPKERLGNGIDWEKAEESGAIKLIDQIEGLSIKRQPLKIQQDFKLDTKVDGMPNIVFSHKKHTVWNGCEVCHPEIFVGVKKGRTLYTMPELFEGKFCGVCHGRVAFPLQDCQRCHSNPV